MTPVLRPALLALVFALGCNTVNVKSELDPSANFAAMSTYAWVGSSTEIHVPMRQGSERVDGMIRTAVDDELKGKGFMQSSDGEADFQVTFRALAEGEEKRESIRRDRGGANVSVPVVQTKGSIVVDFLDPQTQKVLWSGTALSEVDRRLTGDKRAENIREAVRRMLEDFPAKS
jgi:cold shock CspA family protein